MCPIVFVPGLLCTAEVFAPQVAALWPLGPVMVASTLEGETIPDMAAAILANAPARFALVGHSMGGYICFEIMRQAPERVIKLALLSTSARADTLAQSEQRRALVDMARTGDFPAILAQVFSAIGHPSRKNDQSLQDINVRMGVTVGFDGMVRQQEAIIQRVDSRPMLSSITIPTLVLVGNEDPLMPFELAEEMVAGITNAKLVVVDACGHGSTLERPEAVNRALIDWLLGCPEPAYAGNAGRQG